MTITPDNKDWTWVLSRPCPECSFATQLHERQHISTMIRSNAELWCSALAQPKPELRFRDEHWSILEYGCHVRDVYAVYQTRVHRMLTENGPHYDNWDQDITARDDDYANQDAADVARQLEAAAEVLALTFESITSDYQWQRTGFRSDGSSFTIESISRYMIHDTIHHLVDIGLTPTDAGATSRNPA